MLNIISSDIYRVRKGAAFYGVMAGIAGLFLLIAGIFKIISSPGFNDLVEQSAGAGTGLITVEPGSTAADLEEAQRDLEEFLPENGAQFIIFMLEQASNCLPLFLLPFIMAVFGADYSSGAFRNLLSHESGRGKIYVAKLISTMLFTVLMLLGFLVLGGVIGGLFYGFGGFNSAFCIKTSIILGLQMPIYLAFICLGHFIMAFCKRSSYTIATYIVGLFVWTFVLQMLAMAIPGLGWIMRLDLMSAATVVTQYQTAVAADVVTPLIFSAIIIVVTMGLGSYKYKTTDFDFA